MIQQTDFDVETGLPRWGCLFMCLVVASWRATRGTDPETDDVIHVYTDCRQQTTTKWVNGQDAGTVPVLEMLDSTTREIYVHNPTAVVENAISYADEGWRGGQLPDRTMPPTDPPRGYKVDFTLLNYRRASADGHWVLGDRNGMNVVYNPDEALDIDWWSRAPLWRGLRFWKA
jgi:hypothetical protein